MADGNTSQPATELKRVLSDVADNTVRELSHIVAIAKLALAYMERPDAYCFIENIAEALEVVWGRAEAAIEHLYCDANSVGCWHRDEAADRRLVAQMTACRREDLAAKVNRLGGEAGPAGTQASVTNG